MVKDCAAILSTCYARGAPIQVIHYNANGVVGRLHSNLPHPGPTNCNFNTYQQKNGVAILLIRSLAT